MSAVWMNRTSPPYMLVLLCIICFISILCSVIYFSAYLCEFAGLLFYLAVSCSVGLCVRVQMDVGVYSLLSQLQ